MRPDLLALMAAQGGLLTRAQAIACHVPADRVQQLLRTGEWVTVRWGVYAEAHTLAAAQSWTARQRLVDRAACLTMRRPHVLSHDSAALVHGLEVLRQRVPTTHVTRPGLVGSHRRADVAHHLAPYRPEQVVTVGGRRLLDVARTAVDVAREHPHPHGVVACDSARRHGVSLEQLHAAVDPMMRCWPHVTRVREAVELSAADVDTVGETLARLLVSELGRGVPEVQFGLSDGRRTAWCDLRLGRHLVEFDGQVKYRRPADGGVALVPAEDVVWREKQRQDWLCGFKLGMSRLVWADVWGPGRAAALERLRREVADTDARFGTSVADLAPYVVRGPRPSRAA